MSGTLRIDDPDDLDDMWVPAEIIKDGVHLEYMNDDCVWIGITLKDGREIHVHLQTRNGAKIIGSAEYV
tara:strand:+ start:54 stop:260 length:207 start_codon:yes stop_codon:yes gene_type:complete